MMVTVTKRRREKILAVASPPFKVAFFLHNPLVRAAAVYIYVGQARCQDLYVVQSQPASCWSGGRAKDKEVVLAKLI